MSESAIKQENVRLKSILEDIFQLSTQEIEYWEDSIREMTYRERLDDIEELAKKGLGK